MKRISALFLVVILCLGAVGCDDGQVAEGGLWENARHTEDTEVGDGKRTLFVKVEAEGKSIIFTVHTDAKTVGEALNENSLISGEQGAYGLYVKEVNGIVADYDKDQSYWAFNKNGEAVQTGVDMTEFADGEQFELVYTK